MTFLLSLLLAGAGALPETGAPVPLPSGHAVIFHDMIEDAPRNGSSTNTVRFRFVAPQIGGDAALPYEDVAADMDLLCQEVAAPGLESRTMLRDAGAGSAKDLRIVISMMEQPVAFGETTPGIRQYFEAYSLEDGRCIWEAF